MLPKTVHKKKKERIYRVSLIFLSIIFLDLLLNITIHAKSSYRVFTHKNVCNSVDTYGAQSHIKDLPEVKEFEQASVENGNIFNLALSNLGNTWTVEVYATGSGEKEEFNQYTIDSCGMVRCSKKMYFGNKFIRNAEENEFPCASLYDTTQKNK